MNLVVCTAIHQGRVKLLGVKKRKGGILNINFNGGVDNSLKHATAGIFKLIFMNVKTKIQTVLLISILKLYRLDTFDTPRHILIMHSFT